MFCRKFHPPIAVSPKMMLESTVLFFSLHLKYETCGHQSIPSTTTPGTLPQKPSQACAQELIQVSLESNERYSNAKGQRMKEIEIEF